MPGLLRRSICFGGVGNGEESHPTRGPEHMGGVPKLQRRRAKGYGEFRILIRDAPRGGAQGASLDA